MTTPIPKRIGRPPIDVRGYTGGHPLAPAVRARMVERGLGIAGLVRLTAGQVAREAVRHLVIGRPATDRTARTCAAALGLVTDGPPPPTRVRQRVPTTADPRLNLVPSLKWLTLLAESIDERRELGDDIRGDVAGAVIDVAAGLAELLAEVGSPMRVTVE